MDEYYLDEYCKQVERENNDALRRFSLSVWHKGIAKEEQNYKLIKDENIHIWLEGIAESDDTVEIDGLEICKYINIRQMVESIIVFLNQNSEKAIILALPFEIHDYAMNKVLSFISYEINTVRLLAEVRKGESIIEIEHNSNFFACYLKILTNGICKYVYIENDEIIRKEFKIEEKLYEELVQETKQVILENDFEHISEGLALSTNFKKLEIKFSVDGLGTWSSQRIDVKELKKYKNLFKFLNNTQAIEFIKFVKKNGVEDSIEYGFGDLDTVCNLPHRDDGRKLCKTLRNIRKEFSKLNGIDFEFMDCSNISEICAGTCEVCDYEAEQINRRVKKLKNVRYLEFKVD